MRITKLNDKTPYIDSNGKWNVFCQVLKGCTYTYGVVMCDTMEEAFALKEGQIIDAKKFDHRIKNV